MSLTSETFTIRSWDNTNPETFDDYETALAAARARAARERKLVKLRENAIELVAPVAPDGTLGTWLFDSAPTYKEDLIDACDALDMR
jgi:hypothetical protein